MIRQAIFLQAILTTWRNTDSATAVYSFKQLEMPVSKFAELQTIPATSLCLARCHIEAECIAVSKTTTHCKLYKKWTGPVPNDSPGNIKVQMLRNTESGGMARGQSFKNLVFRYICQFSVQTDLGCQNKGDTFTRYGNKAYHMDVLERSFADGEAACQLLNARVATMVTYAEELAVYDFLNKSKFL